MSEPEVTLDRNAYPFQTEVRVRLSETDAVGIVFYGSFSAYMDVGRMDYLNHLGLNDLDGPVQGLAPGAVVRSHLEFRSPARYNDVLIIHVRLPRIGESSYTFHFLITNKRTRAVTATGALTLVWLTPEFAPMRVPEEFRKVVKDFESAGE